MLNLFSLSNGVYDKIKAVVTVGMPAVITLYTALGAIWEWSNTEPVVGTLAAVTTFLGVLVGVNSRKFQEEHTFVEWSPTDYDGE